MLNSDMKETRIFKNHTGKKIIANSFEMNFSIKDEKFDGLLAMGVMPHVENDDFVLQNMRTLIRTGGRVFMVQTI